jgi:hypothetical protein
MLTLTLRRLGRGMALKVFSLLLIVAFVNLTECKEEDCPNELGPRLPPPLAPQEYPHLDDSSRTIFSMYSEISEEEDKNMTERWQKDAKGILIFVSPYVF